MKKTIMAIITTVGLMIGSANAVEIGVNGGYFNSESRYGAGISLSETFGPVEGTVGWTRMTEGESQDRYSLSGALALFDIGPVTLNAGGGVHYLDNNDSDNGWAYTVGAGGRIPLTDQFSVVGDVSYQSSIESRVETFDGVVSTVGMRYSF